MKAKKFLALPLAALLAAAVLTGCANSGGAESGGNHTETAAAVPETITVTFVSSPLNVPSIVEKNHGFFQSAFAEIGVRDVLYSDLTSGADQTQALASGDIQFLYCVGATSVLLSAANGADIQILSMYSRSPRAFCLFSAEEAIHSPEDLRGKTVAGPQGTILHELLAAYLASGGMTIADVEFVNASIPNALAALGGGSADCALLAGAAAYNARNSGLHLVTNGEGLIEAAIVCAAAGNWIGEHPEAADQFLKAQRETLEYMDSHHEEAMRESAEFLDLDVSAVEEMYAWYDFGMEIRDSDIESIKATAQFMLDAGMIEDAVDVEGLILK